jgi:hypothetical protein
MADELSDSRRSAVLLEEVKSQVRQVAEGHGTLIRELQAVRTDLGGRLDFLEDASMKGFGKVWQAIVELNTRVDQLVARM